MEICETLTDGEFMPQGAEGSFSLSGIPPEVVDAMAELAAERGITLREIYTEVATDMVAAVRRGEKQTYISTLGGSTRKTIWVDPEVAAEVDELRKELNRSRSSFMLTAIRRFLIANERSVDF
jgi:hypothetical protein